MIHVFSLGGTHIALDVFSGSVHVMDELSLRATQLYENADRQQTIGQLLMEFPGHPDAEAASLNALLDELDALKESLTSVLAPRDGYVSKLEVKAGDTYDGSRAAYSLSPQNELPVIRVNVSESQKKLTRMTGSSFCGLRE